MFAHKKTAFSFKKNAWLRRLELVLIAWLVLYPLVSMFFGLDLGDTGYHLYAYEHLFAAPDRVNYTTYLSTLIGYIWERLFGSFGLLAFNFLEVLLEWALCALVFKTYSDVLGRQVTLIGLYLAEMSMGTYLNIFNYHQFNVALLLLMLSLQYRAVFKPSGHMSFWAGSVYAALVFARVGSFVAIICLLLYVAAFFYLPSMTGRALLGHIWRFGAGAAAAGGIVLLFLQLTGALPLFYQNIFRLKDIASDETHAYAFSNLLTALIEDNMKIMVVGFIWLAAVILLISAFCLLYRKKRSIGQKIIETIFALATLIFAVYQMVLSPDWMPLPNWPQMTSGPGFLVGLLYVAAWCVLLATFVRPDLHSQKLKLIAISAFLLVILTIAGSNTRLKHVVLGFWLIAPIFIYACRQLFFERKFLAWINRPLQAYRLAADRKVMLSVLIVVSIVAAQPFLNMILKTSNYDATDRTRLTAQVDHPKVRGIYTTPEEAGALEGVLQVLDQSPEGVPMMVFGSSLLFYYLSGHPSYVMPYVTGSGYSKEAFEEDLVKADQLYVQTRPLIVFCRTEYSWGFDTADLSEKYTFERRRVYQNKREVLFDFLRTNQYDLIYQDAYYYVLRPYGATSELDTEALIALLS